MSETKLPYSFFIAGLNEIEHLREVLPFYVMHIQDVHYFDLGSKDGSAEFAADIKGCKVHRVEREPTIEILHFKYSDRCSHDWIVYADPDERWPLELLKDIADKIESDTQNEIGIMASGIQFYLNRYALKGTRWGGIKTRGVAFHRQRVELSPLVHRSKRIKPGFKQIFIQKHIITHYWMKNFGELIDKHRRYLKQEGKSRYESNMRITFPKVIYSYFHSFYECFFIKSGFRDGLKGLMLSIFWAWYNGTSNLRLYRYQKNNRAA